MKNKIYSRIQVVFICLAVLAGFIMVSCNKDDDNGGAVELHSFGPSPVLRGNNISFIGQNMNLITSVVLPENIELTDITVISNSEISIMVPQEAEPGLVVLNYDGGSVTTKSRIAYTEPYEITTITPTESAVREGDVITITGDYLNNIVKVVFQATAAVDSAAFVSQSRKEIKLNVPKEAFSGKIIVEDVDGNQLYSEQELTISLPEITGLLSSTVKAGNDLTINGQNLDLVASIIFPGGSSVEVADYVSQSATSIVVTTPDNLQDGTFTLVSYSAKEITSTQSLTTVMPSAVIISANTRFKAGLEVTIEGVDLDLVTSIMFTGGSEITEFTYADNKISIAIPEDATDGAVILNTASTKSISTNAIELIKPTITSVAPNPVTAGSDVVITGTDLDLIMSVTFGGDVTVDVSPESETNITLTVSLDAITGELALNMANGQAVNSSSITINNPDFCFIPVLPSSDVEINASGVFSFEVVNGDVLTEVKVDGNATQFIVEGTKLHVFISGNAAGSTDLTLVSSTGEVTYQINVIGAGIIETVIFEGPISLSWGDGGRAITPVTAFDGVSAGSVMKIYFVQTENWGQAQINNGSWATIPFAELNNDAYLKTDFYNDKTITEQEIVLTQDVLDNIRNNAADGNGIIIQGSDWIISKISIITTTATETVIMSETRNLGSWAGEDAGGAFRLYKDAFTDVATGSILKFYFSVTGSAQLQINDANWAQQGEVFESEDATLTSYEVELTADYLDHILSTSDGWSETAMVVQGQDLIISKVTVITN